MRWAQVWAWAALVTWVAFGAVACRCDEQARVGRERDAGATVAAAPAQPPGPRPELGRAVREVLEAYEAVRAMLAVGSAGRIAPAARRIESTARRAAELASEPLRTHLESTATAASRLAESPVGDLAEARRGFGDVGRHLIALLAAEPSFAEGLEVYECGEALGYPKWIQRRGPPSDPYVGEPGAACASRGDWTP